MRHIRCLRGLFVGGPSLEDVRRRVVSFPLFHGGTEPASIPLTAHDEWILVGLPRPIPARMLWDLGLHLMTARNTKNLVGVQYAPCHPEKTYYAVLTDCYDENEESPMRGRRDDGRGVRFDYAAEAFRATPQAEGFNLGTLDFLRDRGVPETLIPKLQGIIITPAVLVKVNVAVD